MRPDDGPAYPWGSQPWPGTEHIKDASKNHPGAKDEFWFSQGDFEAVLARLKAKRAEIAPDKLGRYLDDAKKIQAKDFGQWAAGVSLYNSAMTGQYLISSAYQYFINAFDAVINRLETTKKTNTGVEVDNVDVMTFKNVQTVDPGQWQHPGQTNQPGQTDQPNKQPAQPNSYS